MEKVEKKQLKSIKFEIPIELHNEIKKRAADIGCSIKKYMLQAVFVKMKTEDK